MNRRITQLLSLALYLLCFMPGSHIPAYGLPKQSDSETFAGIETLIQKARGERSFRLRIELTDQAIHL